MLGHGDTEVGGEQMTTGRPAPAAGMPREDRASSYDSTSARLCVVNAHPRRAEYHSARHHPFRSAMRISEGWERSGKQAYPLSASAARSGRASSRLAVVLVGRIFLGVVARGRPRSRAVRHAHSTAAIDRAPQGPFLVRLSLRCSACAASGAPFASGPALRTGSPLPERGPPALPYCRRRSQPSPDLDPRTRAQSQSAQAWSAACGGRQLRSFRWWPGGAGRPRRAAVASFRRPAVARAGVSPGDRGRAALRPRWGVGRDRGGRTRPLRARARLSAAALIDQRCSCSTRTTAMKLAPTLVGVRPAHLLFPLCSHLARERSPPT